MTNKKMGCADSYDFNRWLILVQPYRDVNCASKIEYSLNFEQLGPFDWMAAMVYAKL
jgi:hypothetical protein